MQFRAFQSDLEKKQAAGLIASIDQGEKWIFEGANGAGEFGGVISRLYYAGGDNFGTFYACLFSGRLRIQVAFRKDMPDELRTELQALVTRARRQANTFTSVWYAPHNVKLEEWLFHGLPWASRGHKTHEFTMRRENYSAATAADAAFDGIQIRPFESRHTDELCALLDRAMAHTFDDPAARPFAGQRDRLQAEWTAKTAEGDCSLLFYHGSLAGACLLKNAEIDLMAIAPELQGRGLGKRLLHHAIRHIFAVRHKEPYLYCIDRNEDALRFYLREGMSVTGHSGCVFWEAE